MKINKRTVFILAMAAVLSILLLLKGCGGGSGSQSAPMHYFPGRTYGRVGQDIGTSVTQTNDGGYVAIGLTTSSTAGDYDVMLVRTDVVGNVTQKTQFGGSGNDYGFSIVQTLDGGFVMTGVYNCASISTCNTGWTSWPIGYPQDVTGQLFLRKLDANLVLQWETTPSLSNNSMGYCIQQTSDSGFIVGGSAGSAGSAYGLLVKTDSTGTIQWSISFGGKGVSGVRQTTDGGYVVSVAGAGLSTGDVIAKVDASGNITWQTVLNGSSQLVLNTSTGDYVVTGINPLPTAAGNLYLGKISSTGNILWEKAFGGTGGDEGLSIQETSDHGYIATGWGGKLYDNTGANVYLVKTRY